MDNTNQPKPRHKIRRIVIILLVIAAGVVAFGTWWWAKDWVKISDTEYATWQTYTDINNEYSVRYPANVTIQETKSTPSRLQQVRFLGQENLEGIHWPNLSVSLTDDTGKNFCGIGPDRDCFMTIAGHPAREMFMTGAVEHPSVVYTYETKAYQVLYKEKVYEITFVNKKGAVIQDSIQDVNRRFLDSFTFLE